MEQALVKTFAAALHEYNSLPGDVCPCTNTRNSPPPAVPDFVGHDYFCDTGSENPFQIILYKADPLWDGAGCGQYNTCCEWNFPPWFVKNIAFPTSDDIEMRMCTDQPQSDKNINFESLEIYIQGRLLKYFDCYLVVSSVSKCSIGLLRRLNLL